MSKSERGSRLNSVAHSELVRISSSRIKKLKSIGNGGFAEVFLGKWEGVDVAIKQLYVKNMDDPFLDDFLNEAEIMSKCRHPSIINFFGVCTDDDYQFILEYLPRGNLYQNLSNPKIEIPLQTRKSIALDIARGLQYLHSLNIIHQDLKSLNILLSENWRAKITDFGLAKIRLATEVSSTVSKKASSIRWCAPELFKRNAVRTKESDIWSLGVIFWEIIARKIPFAEEANEMIVMGFIKDGEKETIPSNCPKLLTDVINGCWKIDPKERMDAISIVSLMEEEESKEEEKGLSNFVQKINISPEKNDFELRFSRSAVTSEDMIISNDDRTVTFNNRGGNGTFPLNRYFKDGKHLWEFKLDNLRSGEYAWFGILKENQVETYETPCIGFNTRSWGYCSYQKKGYNSNLEDYGERINGGDIIGVQFDFSTGELSFFLNGKNMGVAFVLPTGLTLSPAVSVSYESKISLIS